MKNGNTGICSGTPQSLVCLLGTGQSCGTDATSCSSNVCAEGVCCDTECSGACQTCTQPGNVGTCVSLDGITSTGCGGLGRFCCGGACVSASDNLGQPCGSGVCSGTWKCTGSAAQCTSYGQRCDTCASEFAGNNGTCTDNQGTACAATAAITCSACDPCSVVANVATCTPGSWVTNGKAYLTGSQVTLTDASTYEIGTAWNSTPIDLSNNFDMTFKIYLGASGGADGIDFVLQNDSRGLTAIGGNGHDKGYAESSSSGTANPAISPAVALCIEDYPTDSNLQPQENGSLSNSCTHASGTCPYKFPSPLVDQKEHTYEVQWDATGHTLTLIVDTVTVLTYQRDLVKDVFSNKPSVYYGFTSATGALDNLQYFIPVSCN